MAELFSILSYVYEKVANIINIPDTVWTPIVSVTAVNAQIGVQEIGLSVSATFPDIINSAYLRFRITGGVWHILSHEQKDISDSISFYYAFPHEWTGGDLFIEVEAQKEGGQNSLDVNFADVWIERKA